MLQALCRGGEVHARAAAFAAEAFATKHVVFCLRFCYFLALGLRDEDPTDTETLSQMRRRAPEG